ncbi:cobalt transporter subunit CbtA [Litoreibacter halocynthiae]|uniref:Cobalt transporter subunit CbtA n=1 Tax=Litoreibacter halocynthiae TaxID=1242689 RepID=A0A4R7LE63_9RHOB|nr:CbtA family protein [Litoreibacter halocynthiae]TDT73913.1 cobalt transporter subunit CbtA [Litoreibacter halocynthiae]
MLKHILTSAVFAGIVAGLFAAVINLWAVIPMVMEGELYESGERVHFAVDGSPQSDAGSPSIMDDPARHLMPAAFSVVTFTGYAFLMIAGMALAERYGHKLTMRQGLIWGLCGFITFQLAPAMGMPPQLPATPGPEVVPRQLWWLLTILCTATALGLIAFGRGVWPMVLAAVLLFAPHIIGSPRLDTYFGFAAPELAAHFVGSALAATALTWTMLGLCCAWFWVKLQQD